MKNPIDRMALYIATILISALPFTADAADVTDKTKKQHGTMVKNQVKTCHVQDGKPNQRIES
jgi:hypothetical protein